MNGGKEHIKVNDGGTKKGWKSEGKGARSCHARADAKRRSLSEHSLPSFLDDTYDYHRRRKCCAFISVFRVIAWNRHTLYIRLLEGGDSHC